MEVTLEIDKQEQFCIISVEILYILFLINKGQNNNGKLQMIILLKVKMVLWA